MEYDLSTTCGMADRMAEIKKEIEKLKLEQSEIEAAFLKRAETDLRDTKLKTISYAGQHGGKVTATMAASLKLIYPSYLKQIFGSAYQDVITEETKCKLAAPASRMLTGLWTGDYTRMTVGEVIEQLPCDAGTKALLTKKLKGANYETDKKTLMASGEFSETDAEQYAYFVFEAAIWENFMRLMKTNKKTDECDIAEILNLIDGAVVVEETPKITVELAG